MGRKTQAQMQADRLVELEREKQRIEADRKKYEATVKKAVKSAGFARADAVEQLYELLGIEAETTPRKHADGMVTQVAADRDETRRSRRLLDAVTELLEAAETTEQMQHDDTEQVAESPQHDDAEQAREVVYS